MSLSELLAEIREQTSPQMWSKGVELSRRDAVTADDDGDGEVSLRVLDRGLGRSAQVQLWPDDLDWNSDCSCNADPCYHVIAAAIVLKQSRDQGVSLPKSKTASGKIVYRFQSTSQGLSFHRFIKTDEQETPLTVPLTTSRGTRADIDLSPTKADLGIDVALGRTLQGIIEGKVFEKMSPFLKNIEDVYLDGKKVTVSTEPVGLIVTITDQGTGVFMKGGLDPRIETAFKNNIALIKDSLHPIKDFKLLPGEYKILKSGKFFASSELISLSSQILPGLREKVTVDNQAGNLPELSYDTPRLEMDLKTVGDRLQATPYIVYGSPAIARLQGDELETFGTKVPVRNQDAERKLRDQLSRELGLEPGQTRLYFGEQGVKYLETIKSWRGDLKGQGEKDFALKPALIPSLSLTGNDFNLSFSSSDQGGSEVSPAAVFSAWEKNQSLVKLKTGGWAPLPADWLQKYGQKVLELLMAKEGRAELPKTAIPSLVRLSQDLGQTPSAELLRFKETLENFEKIPASPMPASLNADLRPYQVDGYHWLSYLKQHQLGALLADDMGLGKTLQTIAILEGRCLVVVPTSVMTNWKKELSKFRPQLRVNIYHGPQRRFEPKADVTITSYGLLRLDIETFKAKSFDIVVLDEAQWIKNPDSQVSQAAFQLNASFRVALSGTPVENSLEDLWSQFQFLNPGLLGNRQYFKDQYVKPILDGQAGASAYLQRKIKPFLLRRVKRDVAKELPPKTEKVLYTELSETERQIYDALRAATQKDIVEKLNAGGSVIEALEALLRMRQACCHPSLLPQQQAASSSKLNLLLETLETALAEGHKALVFSQWTSFLDLMEPRFKEAEIPYLRLDGSTRNRGTIVDAFQKIDGPPVLMMSLKAGGVGLNLSQADHVFIMDPWWNPAVEDQAADRAHRIGQENPVMVHPVVALDTVEEKILELQAQKRQLAEAAIGGGQGALKMTRDDILGLFE
ncbi:DEAD/DEAH box helicase [Pseudobacteriovorax antillogorgiicola]|uniref:Helicase conserved C-terminal domain-containing protein n=2 Tax=Pseudobacteriovorax antillogorgiicola TaxID=1513793 RepID=A0A1Y6CQ73_9BACT|nr:DEAD/DEAH box helicase [Pseudobacteriovorax antillogorgiicola]TCS46407.1 helicase-like protein [Pseudobacteriovorax antillogorgiicola]SMF68860.1 Helicase conserved C-terminal domain-containing protein [Pseudobacteriovorax antillogorgiicola]